MKLEQNHINKLITEYIEDSYSFGDDIPTFGEDTSDTITEILNSYKQLILESNQPVITLEALKSHASSLTESKKEIFNDFILYLQMTELDNKLFN
jgi:hypothetical protein